MTKARTVSRRGATGERGPGKRTGAVAQNEAALRKEVRERRTSDGMRSAPWPMPQD